MKKLTMVAVAGLAVFAASVCHATPLTFQGVFTGVTDTGGGFDRLGIAADTDTMNLTWSIEQSPVVLEGPTDCSSLTAIPGGGQFTVHCENAKLRYESLSVNIGGLEIAAAPSSLPDDYIFVENKSDAFGTSFDSFEIRAPTAVTLPNGAVVSRLTLRLKSPNPQVLDGVLNSVDHPTVDQLNEMSGFPFEILFFDVALEDGLTATIRSSIGVYSEVQAATVPLGTTFWPFFIGIGLVGAFARQRRTDRPAVSVPVS